MLSFLFFEVKTQQYFVSLSYRFLDRKTLLKIWHNSGLNLTIFRIRGTRGPFLESPCNFSGPLQWGVTQKIVVANRAV